MNQPATAKPDRPQTLVSSSSVIGYSYNSVNYTLDVFYKSKHGSSIYRYFLVYPPVVSQMFDQGAGIGKKVRKMLKGVRYQKLG